MPEYLSIVPAVYDYFQIHTVLHHLPLSLQPVLVLLLVCLTVHTQLIIMMYSHWLLLVY